MTDILATIQRGLKAPKDKENKFGGYNYRNAEGILRAFKDVQPEGVSLTMSDAITLIGDRLFLTATVKLHHGGNIIAEAQGAAMHALAKKGMDDAQITGACSSYARKYALCGLFAIDDSTDDPDSKDNSRATDNAAEEDAKAAAKAQEAIGTASTVQELEAAWLTIPVHLRKDKRLLKAATDRKAEITNEKEAA